MSVFLDSGILLRVLHRADPRHFEVRKAIVQLVSQGSTLFTGLQQFAEFWNVSSRPPGLRGGFNLPLDEVANRLRRIERGVKDLAETPATPEIWKSLVQKHAVRGVQVHDARTAAMMLTHSVRRLLTLNKADFVRYESEGLIPMFPSELSDSLSTT